MVNLLSSTDVTSVVVFLVAGIVLGGFLEFVLRNFSVPIPYTVLVFYTGVILGSIVNAVSVDVSEFLSLSGVSADLIVYGFLPSLLFSECMGLNLHSLLQCFYQAVVLAGPGAIIVSVQLAVLAYYILPFNWTWMYCFLFGAILCATDPVSVVSLMKTTNASTKLTMVISGESLLNDGSAMILYFFIYNMINGVTYDAGTLIAFIAKMLILSPTIGFLFGIVASRLMRRFNRPLDSHLDLQLIVTFACAYASFYVAQGVLGVSGVLSCCAAGFAVSLFAPVKVLHDEKFHHVWEYAEWACNTWIFLLAGFIGGGKTSSAIQVNNILYLILFFILLLITRGIMVFIVLPLLNRVGEEITVPEALFSTFAGLRGALSIALALEGANNADENGNGDVGKDLFFMVTGLASFTLLINGSLAGVVLLKLKLVDDPDAPVSPQLLQVIARIKIFISSLLKKELQEISSELGDYDEKELSALCELLHTDHRTRSVNISTASAFSLPNLGLGSFTRSSRTKDSIIDRNTDSTSENRKSKTDRSSSGGGGGGGGGGGHNPFRLSLNNKHLLDDELNPDWETNGRASIRVSTTNQIDKDTITYTRTTFLDVVRAKYLDYVQAGKIGSISTPTRMLLYSLDVAFDNVEIKINDWDVLVKILQPSPSLLGIAHSIDNFFYLFGYLPGFVSRIDVMYERIAIYVITNYIYAHEYAQSRINYFLGGEVNREFDIAAPEHQQVLSESKEMVEKAKQLLLTIKRDDLRKVYTQRAAKVLLMKQADILHNIVSEGILSEKNARYLFESLQIERDRIHILRSQQEKKMIAENIAERLEIERELRQSIQQNPRLATLPSSIILPRSNFQQNLAEQDGERSSTISRINLRPSQIVQSPGSSTVYNPQHLAAAAASNPSTSTTSDVDIEQVSEANVENEGKTD